AWVEKYFGSIPSGPPVPKITAVPPQITSEKRSKITDQVELPRVYMGWIMPSIFQPGDAESDLLAEILGGGKSSRLYKSLVYEKQIAQEVTVTNQSLRLGSVFELQATVKPGVKPEDLGKATDEDLKLIVADKLKSSARVVVYGLPGDRVVDDPPASKEAANAKAKSEAVANTMPDEPWRAKAPGPQPLGKLTLPVAQSFKLANGLSVILMEQHRLPIVVAHLLVLNGSDANPVDKPGLASFTSEMLPEGTERRTSTQVADDAAQIGASLRALTVSDDSIVDIRTLKPNVDA